jgi:type III pantothenate kinase
MDLVIDIGNNFTKYALFEDDSLVLRSDEPKGAFLFLQTVRSQYEIQNVIVSSVRPISAELESYLSEYKYVLELTYNIPLPINLNYETPATLGRDRIAAVVGAQAIWPDSNCLVVDAGTCITYDFIDSNGEYQGGSISPGLQMRYQALNNFTGALPLIEHQTPVSFVGKSTEMSIRTGVFNGLIHEINGTIRRYKLEKSPLNLVICGGNAKDLIDSMEEQAFHEDNLVLKGLHKILIYNALQNI